MNNELYRESIFLNYTLITHATHICTDITHNLNGCKSQFAFCKFIARIARLFFLSRSSRKQSRILRQIRRPTPACGDPFPSKPSHRAPVMPSLNDPNRSAGLVLLENGGHDCVHMLAQRINASRDKRREPLLPVTRAFVAGGISSVVRKTWPCSARVPEERISVIFQGLFIAHDAHLSYECIPRA